MGKRIAVVGVGALGGYVGGWLAHTGEDVTLIDFWPENIETIRKNGLELDGVTPEEKITVRNAKTMHLTEMQDLSRQKPIDIAFVCMKSYDTAWATTMVKQYLAPDAYVVSLQNCINEETIAGIAGWGRVLGTIASSITVDLCEPGHVRRAAGKSGAKHTVFRVGEVHGRITERAKEVCRLVALSDSAKVTDNLWGERWSKLVTNAMANGMSACTGLISREILLDDTLRHFTARLGSEAIRVGQALGYSLEEVHHLDPEVIARAGEGDPEAKRHYDEHRIREASKPGGGAHRPVRPGHLLRPLTAQSTATPLSPELRSMRLL